MLQSLEAPPSSADPLFWTDFVELRALIHPDRCYSRGDLLGLLKRNRDTSPARSAPGDEARWRDLINFAGARTQEFGLAYPFSVSDDCDTLAFSGAESVEQHAYLRLLMSSLMRHFPRTRTSEIGRFFEEVSHAVFRRLMPEGTQVHPTWASGGEEARYKGPIFEKMTMIAKDIRCSANFQERDFKPNDTGDGGIDIIAWHPMADDREGIPLAFAQCGCSKDDWKFKQLEASPAKHYRQLPAMHAWATYYFLPLDLRHADGDWAYKSDIGQAIIVDRLRLLRLSQQFNLLNEWPGLDVLDEVSRLKVA